MLLKINSAVLSVMRFIICVTGIVSTSLILINAGLRYFFQINFLGVEEYIMIVAFWLYFIGSAYASYEDSHINADLISSFIKNEKVLHALMILRYSLSVIISAIATVWCFQYVAWNMEQMPTTSVHKLPLVAAQISILISFILMFIYMVMHLINRITKKSGEATK